MQKVLSRVGACLLVGVPVAMTLAQPCGTNPVCFVQTWFDVTQTNNGGCGVSYVDCPGRVLCGVGGDNWPSSAITTMIVECACYTEGVSGPNGCEGGIRQTPCNSFTNPIPYQDCNKDCYTVIVPP